MSLSCIVVYGVDIERWRHVGIAYADEAYGAGFAAGFDKACFELGVKVRVTVSYSPLSRFPADIYGEHPAIQRLKTSGVRVILLAAAGAPAAPSCGLPRMPVSLVPGTPGLRPTGGHCRMI